MHRRDRQQRLYSKVLASADGKPVVFRTVDIGGDKALPYLTDIRDEAENPAMGWRALRLSLDRSTLMKAQARALIEASGGQVLRVMFPMISEPWEFDQARDLFQEQIEWARKSHRKLPSRVEFGAMLEVPSLAEVLDLLLPKYVRNRIFTCLLSSAASELAARQRAMKSATDNAGELIKKYERLANQARQAGITQEISEIVGGANALADAKKK